jgi:hypothetical protein
LKAGWRARGATESQRRTAVAAALAFVAGSLCNVSIANAQVVWPPIPPQPTPWNALQVMEPVPFVQRWEMSGVEDIRPEDTPVKTRLQPGYEVRGVRAGDWLFQPSLTAGGFYSSNVFASPTDKRSDMIFRLHPSLRVDSLWERHSLSVQADVESETYRSNPGLDQVNASIRARGRFDIWHDTAILTNFRVAKLHEDVGSLSSPAGAVQPTPYDFATGDVTFWRQFNRLSVSGGVRVDSYDYGSTRAQNGAIINQDSRDGQIYVGHSRVEYVFSPYLGVFGAVEGNRRELRGSPVRSLSSDGYRTLGGVNLELSRLVKAEIAVGYADQMFDAPSIARAAGPAYRFLLTWSPTRLLDIKFRAESMVTQAVDTDVAGIRAESLQLGFDYELRRNVIVSAAAIYERDKFLDRLRDDTVFATLEEVRYMLNRFWSVSLRHQYIKRESNVPTAAYDRHEVGLNVTARF